MAETVISSGDKFSGDAEIMGMTYYSVYEPLKDSSGRVIGMIFMGIPPQAIDGIEHNYIFSVGSAFLVTVILIAAVVTLFVGRMVNKLSAAVQALGVVASGNFRGEDLDEDSQDEIGDVCRSANKMKKDLKEVLKNVYTVAEQLAASSEELTAGLDQTSNVIQEVAGSATRMSDSTDNQSRSFHEINTRAMEMGKTMEGLLEDSEEM